MPRAPWPAAAPAASSSAASSWLSIRSSGVGSAAGSSSIQNSTLPEHQVAIPSRRSLSARSALACASPKRCPEKPPARPRLARSISAISAAPAETRRAAPRGSQVPGWPVAPPK